MMASPVNGDDRCEQALRRCRNLLRTLSGGVITFDEFAYNFATTAATTSADCIGLCVNLLPQNILPEMTVYLRNFLEPVDFMPSPAQFIPGTATIAEIEQLKRQYRPNYVQLYELIKRRPDSPSGQA